MKIAERPKVTWEEVKDIFLPVSNTTDKLSDFIWPNDEIYEMIQKYITEFKNREKLKDYGLKPINALLFYGAPGLGKTFLPKCLANEFNIPLYILNVGELLKDTNGLSNMNKVFNFVQDPQNQPCILFMDECDGVVKSRENENVPEHIKVLTNLIMQRLQEENDDLESDLTIIAATNFESQVDDATKTRFQIQLEFLLPEDYKPFIITEANKNKMFRLIDDVSDDEMKLVNLNAREAKFSIREMKAKIVLVYKAKVLDSQTVGHDIIEIKLSDILKEICQHIKFDLEIHSIEK